MFGFSPLCVSNVSPKERGFPCVAESIEVTSVINILCGGREEGVSFYNLPSLH